MSAYLVNATGSNLGFIVSLLSYVLTSSNLVSFLMFSWFAFEFESRMDVTCG